VKQDALDRLLVIAVTVADRCGLLYAEPENDEALGDQSEGSITSVVDPTSASRNGGRHG
jgi:hypothetical protein